MGFLSLVENNSIQTGENISTNESARVYITGNMVYNLAYNQILQTKETNEPKLERNILKN